MEWREREKKNAKIETIEQLTQIQRIFVENAQVKNVSFVAYTHSAHTRQRNIFDYGTE